MSLRLLHFQACPYCEKVRFVLRRIGLPYESVVIDPADRGEVERLSSQRLVPVLCDDERTIPDSTRILRYLIARYGEHGLLPADPSQQALAWIVEDYADEVLGPLLHSLLVLTSSSDGRSRKELERQLETHHRNLEQLLASRDFVFGGDSPTIADIAIYAFLSRLVLLGGREISAGFPRLRSWYVRMDSLAGGAAAASP